MTTAPVPFDPERLVRTLRRHRVDYVLIGALAARLYGFPRLTADADITPSKDDANLKRLAAALRDLDAKVYTDSVPEGLVFDCSAAMLSRAAIWTLVAKAGRVDVNFEPAGTDGYADLRKDAEEFSAFGGSLYAASLDDIIRMKEAADRPKDRQDILLLREIRKREK